MFVKKQKFVIDKAVNEFEKMKKSAIKAKKADFQKVIDEYKKEKEDLVVNPVEDFLTAPASLYVNPSRSMICSKCGKFFNYPNSNPGFSSSVPLNIYGIGGDTVYCTHCGNINYP